jgi:hypothetical protein
VKWTVDFMSDREIYPRRGETQGNPFKIDDGLPQGSPASPVIFSLLLSPAVKDKENRYAYADDVSVMAKGSSAEEALEKAGREANQLARELRDLGLEIEPSKTEAIIFTKRGRKIPTGQVVIRGHAVETKEQVKYLGVHIDNRLSFKKHVTARAAQGWGITKMIKKLTQDMGLRTEATLKLIKTVLVPTLTYGSEVWWRGKEDEKGNLKTKRQQGLVSILERPLTACKRYAIGAHRGTRNQVVDWETGIPNMEDILENLRDGASLRLNSLEKGYPAIWPKKNSKARVNRLRRYMVRDGGEEPWV